MPQAADPDDDGRIARLQDAGRLLGGAIGRDAGVRVRRHVDRVDALGQLDQGALRGQKVVGEAAVGVDAGE